MMTDPVQARHERYLRRQLLRQCPTFYQWPRFRAARALHDKIRRMPATRQREWALKVLRYHRCAPDASVACSRAC